MAYSVQGLDDWGKKEQYSKGAEAIKNKEDEWALETGEGW